MVFGVFLYTSIHKLMNVEYLAYSIRNYPAFKYLLSPFASSYFIAFLIISFEVGFILLFFFSRLVKAYLYILFLLILYSVNLLSLIIENTYYDCGCGLFYTTSNPPMMILTDLLLIILVFNMYQISKSDGFSFIQKVRELFPLFKHG